MNDVIRHGNEGIDFPDVPDYGAAERVEYEALMDEPCYAPDCDLRNRDHSPEQTKACLERYLTSEREAER